MACFSGLGIGLSFLFGCIFLGLVAEIYYVLWWKKRNTGSSRGIEHPFCTNHIKRIPHLFRWKKPSSEPASKTQQVTNSLTNPDANNGPEPDLELGLTKDLMQQHKGYGEEGVEAELIRLHNLCGPPRFLFTINEETKEDLESNDGRSRKGSRARSLSDFLVSMETPVLTPLASPTVKGNNNPLDSYNGFNPLFESFSEAEINKMRSSPPPKFKFLRDAEEKLLRRLMEEAQKRALMNHYGSVVQDSAVKANPNSNFSAEEKDASCVRVVVGKSKEREATASQVLPLASSPSRFRPVEFDNKNPVQQ
ncbi:hypothetical protein RHGRI_036386 [Rhododendron griersonianum]|uniref:Uncharacterized protein n=1 Tax=Rhododendron griersonianum TaxID=479676 RepID=A0AAV6HT73_9ERIC|nr:hypothetical protein RHGRI_036386 [Rhododendron griersonianum]